MLLERGRINAKVVVMQCRNYNNTIFTVQAQTQSTILNCLESFDYAKRSPFNLLSTYQNPLLKLLFLSRLRF